MTKSEFAKIHAYDCIMKHLQGGGKDCRHREQMRSKIAIRHITGWLWEGEALYEDIIIKNLVDASGPAETAC